MFHTGLGFETPNLEPTKAEILAAERLDIPAEAMAYIMQVWEQAAIDTLWPRPGRE